MTTPTFNQRLGGFPPVKWEAGPLTGPNGPAILLPKVIAVEDRPCGVLDGVSAAILLQGIESTRLLMALNDHLVTLGKSLLAGDISKAKLFLERDLGSILSTIGQHIETSGGAVHAAMDAHDALSEPKVSH